MDIGKSKEITQFSSCTSAMWIPISWAYQNVWKKRKKVLNWSSLATNEFTCIFVLNAYIRKEEGSQINNLSFNIKILKKGQIKFKAKNEMINIRKKMKIKSG